MSASFHSTLAERIESLKAGSLTASVAALFFGLTIVSHLKLAYWLEPVEQNTDSLNLVISWAIATFSGFLFGVTYRYVIRQDQNPHLKSGAVLAFGLVRGLAQTDAGLAMHRNLLSLSILGLESILLFAAASLVLDWALSQGWVKPFKTT